MLMQAMLLSAGFRMDERELASCSLGPSTWAGEAHNACLGAVPGVGGQRYASPPLGQLRPQPLQGGDKLCIW